MKGTTRQYLATGLAALAVTGARRFPQLPELATVAEAGLPGYESGTWYAILGTAGMPRTNQLRLNADIVQALGTAEVRERLLAQGVDPAPTTPEQLAALMKADMARFGRVIKTANIKAE